MILNPVSHSKPAEGLMGEKAFVDGVRYLGNRNLSLMPDVF